jgi:hypothetical protein
MGDFLWALGDDCRTPQGLREIAILRTAVRHSSEFEWLRHEAIALPAGVLEYVVASGRWLDEPAYAMVPRVPDALGVPTEQGAVSPVPLPPGELAAGGSSTDHRKLGSTSEAMSSVFSS